MAKPEILKQLGVNLPGQHYPIIIGNSLLSDKSLWQRLVPSGKVMIVSNHTVAPLYLSLLQQAFGDYQCDSVILQDGEKYKNQESLFAIYDALIEKGHHRDTTLLALGGGVVGDITGFAAATYQRGVRYLQIPTTLLAQVDASVGGKTAINHPLGKNMIGSFYQPQAVVMDLTTLKSLPAREFNAGVAEVIKYAVLAGGDCLLKLKALLKTKHKSNPAQWAEMIAICCQIKADFVEEDERESGPRALLNLGHTIGHALEAYTHYQRWLHGEAVAIGLYCAALLSAEICNLPKESIDEIEQLLVHADLPRRIPVDVDLKQLHSLLFKDKKIKNNKLRFVLIKNMGDCYLEEQVDETCLSKVLKRAVEGE